MLLLRGFVLTGSDLRAAGGRDCRFCGLGGIGGSTVAVGDTVVVGEDEPRRGDPLGGEDLDAELDAFP